MQELSDPSSPASQWPTGVDQEKHPAPGFSPPAAAAYSTAGRSRALPPRAARQEANRWPGGSNRCPAATPGHLKPVKFVYLQIAMVRQY